MINEPGASLDLGTFISYLLPGYLLEALCFCVVDSVVIMTNGKSLLSNAHWGTGTVAVGVILLSILSYLLGLVLDTVAHPRAYDDEMCAKDAAYTNAIGELGPLLPLSPVSAIMVAPRSESEPLGGSQRDRLIDALFYRLATPQIWARQNAQWAFYEALRNLGMLLTYMVAIPAFYITMLIIIAPHPSKTTIKIIHGSGDLTVPTWALAFGVAALVSFLLFMPPLRLHKRIRSERDNDCRIYYRHRAWVVLGYMIDRSLSNSTAGVMGDEASMVGARYARQDGPHTHLPTSVLE